MTTTMTTTTTIALPVDTVQTIARLLERCDALVRHADPAARDQLIAHLGPQTSSYDLNLFIDGLGFTAALLRSRLTKHQLAQQAGASA
jgi:hypothetical protein